MDKKSLIKQLIFKLNENDISPEELGELITIIKNNKDSELNQYLSEVWTNSITYEGIETSESLLSKIHSKLTTDVSITQPGQLMERRGLNRKLHVVIRYAAIFIFAFGIYWLSDRLLEDKGSNNVKITKNNEITVSYGSKSRIVLPDGTVVNLNSGSRIKYASNFESNRKVYLEGEAFFNVKKDPDHPFLVQTSDIVIRVLGTVFNVKSYPEENIIETTLVSGSVQIFEKNGKTQKEGKKIALLEPNQKAVFFKKETRFDLVDNHQKEIETLQTLSPLIKIEKGIKTELVTAWKDNQLVFSNEKFGTLVPKLERWFNIKIENNYPELNNSRLTGKFDQETLEQALDALRIITPFKYRVVKNKLTIYN